ncbi:molybdenum cofactor guanylyltransferase MobA [Chitinimonas arctica]|nr:molybdenum cofactor guanylyltransferase MobA [Chitinimonas arctica]
MTIMIELNYQAVILAGGRGSRMDGRDKGLAEWRGRPLFRHMLAKLVQQSRAPLRIAISANRNDQRYAEAGWPVLADRRDGFDGPLAGIETALQACQADWLLCLPCDTPQLPNNLAERLMNAASLGNAKAAYVTTAAGPQPACCLVHRSLLEPLAGYLDSGRRRVLDWLVTAAAVPVHFAEAADFNNFNTAADLAAGEPLPCSH